MHLTRWRSMLVAALALALAAVLTLGADVSETATCFVCDRDAVAEAVLNVLLFTPIGAAFAWMSGGLVLPVVAGIGLAGSIETAQLLIPTREPSVSDAVLNGAGAVLGAVIARSAAAWLDPGPALARRLAWCAAAATAAVLGLTAWLLEPAFPEAPLFAQVAPRLGHLVPFEGAVHEAWLGDLRLHDGPIAERRRAHRLLVDGARVAVVASAGTPRKGLASIVSVADDGPRGHLLLGADGAALVLQVRARAARFDLRAPDLRLAGALPPRAGDARLHAAAWRDRRGWCLATNTRARCGMRLTVGDGWSLLVGPWRGPELLEPVLGAAWLGLLLAPLGYWARAARAVVPATLVPALLLLVALVPGAPVSFADLAGALLGLAAGAAARTPLYRADPRARL